MSNNPYQNLRAQAFVVDRSDIGIGKPAAPSEPWAVIMEVGMEGATATVVAFKDGTASIYLSSGGGFIGGAKHKSVRVAAQRFVVEAAKFVGEMEVAAATPEPVQGQTIFYLRTDQGIFQASASEQELGENRHVLSPLFYAGQEVLTQYRLKMA